MKKNIKLYFFVYIIAFVLLTIFIQNSYAIGLIYGNIISASTCMPIAGAKISSVYNNNATNISAASGAYSLALGLGNWTIYVKANGYYSENYTTPYIYNIELNHNFALLPFNGKIGTCLKSIKNITIPLIVPIANNTNSTKTPITTPSIANTTPKNNTFSTVPQSNNSIYIIAIIILVIIVLIVLLKRRNKKAPLVEEHFIHPQELIKQ
ncbi:MAG: hypothetical protein ACP5UN_01320 [Candidatus Micrarchaeia archaeon]